MKWIMFFQTPNDRVKYQTDELDESSTMQYKKFIEFLHRSFFIRDRQGLLDSLDSFRTILLDSNGEYAIIRPDTDLSKISFDELLKLNEEKKEETNLDIAVSKSKQLLDNLWKTNRERGLSFLRRPKR